MSGRHSSNPSARLERIAASAFGLEVHTVLPVSESFSSTVLRFAADDGRQYVVKQPWSQRKAEREEAALLALHDHPDVPKLLAVHALDGVSYLLIEGRDATPWTDVANAGPELLVELGRSMQLLHAHQAESFDGLTTWHELLQHNADRYQPAIGPNDRELADKAVRLLGGYLHEVPDSDQAVLVHFDLRPGNLLVKNNTIVGLIDFESCRGGHASMDFFKLWQQVAPHVPDGLDSVVAGYRSAAVDQPAQDERVPDDMAWLNVDTIDRLMRIYSIYHGLAGLGWCYIRNDFRGSFPAMNRELITTGAAALVS